MLSDHERTDALLDQASAQAPARAERAFNDLTGHLARLVGEIGIMTLFKRAVILSSARLPWLADAASATPGSRVGPESLRAVLARQAPADAADGFATVLSTFVGLLERLIGEPLVRRMLHEVWPTVFQIERSLA